MLRLLPLIAVFVSFLNILLGHIANEILEIRPRLSFNQTKNHIGISNFHNLSTAMASDVPHISKIWMSKPDRKTREQMTVILKICYTELRIYLSCLELH